MKTLFEYRRIGQDFQREMAELVSSGQSTVLLSLRDLGKRYVLKRLGDTLLREGAMLLVEIEFPHEPAMLVASQVQDLLKAAVSKAAPGFVVRPTPSPNELLQAVKQLCEEQPRRVVLLASNVDSLAHHLAQSLLREARVLVSNSQNPITAVLTGEENLQDLVYGPESEFNCAQQFFVQGFEKLAFLDYIRQRREVTRISFIDETVCLCHLFHHTGGNIHLGRAVLWAWLETRARTPKTNDRPVSETEFVDFLAQFPASNACGMDVYFQTSRVIASAPEAWKDLESLRQEIPVSVSARAAPHALEFAGLAIRSGGQLQFASPIMEQFARCHYDCRRLGDLHAVRGKWDEAFRFYEQMPEPQRLRPGGSADVPRLALVIKAFIAEMHTLATRQGMKSEEKMRELKAFFARGCQFVLGVSDVTFWQFAVQWEPQVGQTIEPVVRNLASDILESANRTDMGWQQIPTGLGKRGALAVLRSERSDWRDAVVVSDARRTVAISKERRDFLHELLDHFACAYDHTIANWGVRLRLAARHNHLEIATKIVNALGETVRNPDEALRIAGDELLKLGYRRIMFAMVDPKRQRIRGVRLCCGTPPKKDVAKETDWALADWQEDIQPWVEHHRQPCTVIDWRTWNELPSPDLPPINKKLCEDAETALNFAVIPMMLRVFRADGSGSEEVFGTIHIEREDGFPPSDDEIDDLLEFGRQMAAAAHQAERVGALLDALHSDQDSVVVFDDDSIVRFANQMAAKRFSIVSGWHEAHENIRLIDQELMATVTEVIATGKPLARHDTSPQTGKELREAVFCSPLPDWRKEKEVTAERTEKAVDYSAIGAVVYIHDLTGLHRVFAALQKVARHATDRESTITALLQRVREMGYQQARLYLVDTKCPDVLRSARALGHSTEESQHFADGHYSMNRHDPNRGDTWKCLETGEPRIHQWNRSTHAPPEEKTVRGVTVYNLVEPVFRQPWKKEGDVWIDLPLMAPGRAIGKLTIHLGQNLHCDLEPEEFELLKLFTALFGALLDALDQQEKWVREAAKRAMADTAHTIGTKLAGLSGFAADYRRAAPGNGKVEEINQWMEPIVRACFEQVKQIREAFTGTMELNCAPRLVGMLLEGTLEGLLGSDRRAGRSSWQIVCPAELTFRLDANRLRNALEAMLENSRAMIPAERKLELILRAEEFRREEKSWLRLTVCDNGPGIPSDQRERIFEPFYSKRFDGKRSTGLGLSFVQRVVAAHGGTVKAVGPDGLGAEFVIEIPEKP